MWLFKKSISIILVLTLMISFVGCGVEEKKDVASKKEKIVAENKGDKTEKIETEKIETEEIEREEIITEKTLSEFITSEIYLKEITVAENKITELLLEEDIIDEVLFCKTIYVPQDNIDEFSENSQIKQLIGLDVDYASVLKKISVGTGVIVTLTLLTKINVTGPIISVINAAASKSMKFAVGGAVVGSLYGGLTGLSDKIDESQRMSATIGFALATVGLILTIVSLVSTIPSLGGTTVSLAAGLKMVLAAVSVIATTGETVKQGYEAVKYYKETDAKNIDWDDIKWDKAGENAVQQAINNASDGYMWGAFVGGVYGGVEGYEFYHKYGAPYTNLRDRINQTPIEGKNGKWEGKRGESNYVLNEPFMTKDGKTIKKITYKNGIPDFSECSEGEVTIDIITSNRNENFKNADKVLAELWNKIKYLGKEWTVKDVKAYREKNNLIWHEMSNMKSMQLVPEEVHRKCSHYGGVVEYKTMIGQGVKEFD